MKLKFRSPARTVRIWSRGQLTLPSELRRALRIGPDSTLEAFAVGDSVVLTPKRLAYPDLAREVTEAMAAEGLTLDDLLRDLEEQRERYNREGHGI